MYLIQLNLYSIGLQSCDFRVSLRFREEEEEGKHTVFAFYILVANPCNARASCEIGLLVKDNLSNLLKITTHICIKITTQIET